MGRHFRRYCFYLAEKLKMSVSQIMELDSREISEWMAYDLTNNPEWVQKYNKQLELDKFAELSVEDQASAFKRFFKGK
jgi:hypothetical protein